MATALLFGTAGVPGSSPQHDSVSGVAQIRLLGLEAMELAWVQQVRISKESATAIRRAAEEHCVHLSVHAPYYINLNSPEADKVTASRERILKAARAGAWAGATDIVFHPGFYHDDPPEVVYERIRQHLLELTQQLQAEGVEVTLRPETTGKPSQFGSLDELLQLCLDVPGVYPCVDFAHLHARTGADNSYQEFVAILHLIESRLGHSALESMHIHVSGMEYTAAGEREHLMLKDSDLAYLELLQALRAVGIRGTVICESPDPEADALLLQRLYRTLE